MLLQKDPDIKIIISLRKSGKSMLLEEYIKENYCNANIILYLFSLNFI